jgi:hypothetical protein
MDAANVGQVYLARGRSCGIARPLHGGNFPPSSAYPGGVCEARDLLGRRTWLVRHRPGVITPLQILNAQ